MNLQTSINAPKAKTHETAVALRPCQGKPYRRANGILVYVGRHLDHRSPLSQHSHNDVTGMRHTIRSSQKPSNRSPFYGYTDSPCSREEEPASATAFQGRIKVPTNAQYGNSEHGEDIGYKFCPQLKDDRDGRSASLVFSLRIVKGITSSCLTLNRVTKFIGHTLRYRLQTMVTAMVCVYDVLSMHMYDYLMSNHVFILGLSCSRVVSFKIHTDL